MARKKSDRDIQEERSRCSTWAAYASGTNALAQATKQGEVGKRHIVHGFSGGYSDADPGVVPGKLRLDDGSTIIVTIPINNGDPGDGMSFPQGLDVFGENQVLTVKLDAGGAGVIGHVCVWGTTIDAEESL